MNQNNNKFSYEKDTNQKPLKTKTFNQKSSKNEVSEIIAEISRPKINEKEFYEKFKDWAESSSDSFGQTIIECLKIIIQKNFLAYQLFKILMTSKVKAKLKLITLDHEQNFYFYFWQVMDSQKGSVKIEGLKLLGYLTSEHLQNMAQQTQINCLNSLKKLSNIKDHSRNVNVIRFSFNCIGNILTNSNYKFIDENHEIFYNVYDLLTELNSPQKLEDSNNIRVLAASLRVLGCLYIDFKVFPQNIADFLISQLLRYLYLGTSFFPLPNTFFPAQSGTSSDSAIATSSSEISESDDTSERKKEDESCAKIRNYSAVCLGNIFRQNNKIIPQYFSTLLPCKLLRKEVLKFVENYKEPLLISDLEFPEKRNKRATYLFEFRNDFNEPTLLNLLLFDDNTKVKLSICKTIAAILDGYQGDKLLLIIDGEKLEKSKIEPYKSKSHQIYQTFKNLTLAVSVAILLETDETIVNHLLRLSSTVLSHPSYDKVGHLTIQTFMNTILSRLLPRYFYHTIYLSCISCFGSLANGNIKHKTFEKLAFTENFNIVKILITSIKEALDTILINKDVKTTKSERVPDSTILLESIIALSKFPKHYVGYILEHAESLTYILEKIQKLDKKYINVTFKLIEEIMKYITNSKEESENIEMDTENMKKDEIITLQPVYNQIQLQQFHSFLAKFIKGILSDNNNDNTEHALDILYNLEEKDWELYYSETRDKFIEILPKLNTLTSFKQSFLRLLGKVCIFPSFINMPAFPKLVYNSVRNNSTEKNNNIMIKNSWVLANLCANLKSFEMFSNEENQEILLMSLSYCNSTKEKLTSNGFRALGYFISNNSDEILCQTLTFDTAKAENIKRALTDVYKKPFAQSSVKVCWNVCVSLSNVFRSFKPNFMQAVFQEEMLQNIVEILATKNNFKTQIHCIEMLTLAYMRFPQSSCFRSLVKTLINLYFAPDEGDFDVSELRYLPHLRSDISNLLLRLLKDFDYDKESKYITDILSSIPHKIFRILYDTLEKSFKEHRDKLVEEKWKGDEENQSPTITHKQDLLNYDEVMVKGATFHQQLAIPTTKLEDIELVDFKNCLVDLQFISQKMISLIDTFEDISVPFSVYNSLKQLADINFKSEEKIITLDLDRI